MSELRAINCPLCGPVVGTRIAMLGVRCDGMQWTGNRLIRNHEACGTLIFTCRGCGGMTATLNGIVLRCVPCAAERMALPSDLDAAPARPVAPATLPTEKRADVDRFMSMPMPVFRKGAQLPSPPKVQRRAVGR